MGDLSPHFSRHEFECACGCGFDTVDTELLTIVEVLRDYFDASVIVNSGCRCRLHNESVGGSVHSQHMVGRGADFEVEGVLPSEVQSYIEHTWPDRYGLGRYDGFTHVDSRSGKARWSG